MVMCGSLMTSTSTRDMLRISTVVYVFCFFNISFISVWIHIHIFRMVFVYQLLQLHPDKISITAVLIEYETLTKRQMHGVTTGWLRYRRPTETERPTVPIFVRKSQFRLPFKPDVPVILIGPGTGLAPMRGFIQDRYAVYKDGKTISSAFACAWVL